MRQTMESDCGSLSNFAHQLISTAVTDPARRRQPPRLPHIYVLNIY